MGIVQTCRTAFRNQPSPKQIRETDSSKLPHLSAFLAVLSPLTLLLTSCFAFATTAPYEGLAVELLANEPACGPYTYAQEVRNGRTPSAVVVSKPLNIYCTALDEGKPSTRAFEAMNALLSKAPIQNLAIAYFAIEDERLINSICRAMEVSPTMQLNVIVRSDAFMPPLEKLTRCAKAAGAKEPTIFYRGHTSKEVRAFHYKILMVEYLAGGDATIVVGSGNLAGGLRGFFDNWNIVTATPQSDFARAHRCLLDQAMASNPSTQKALVDSQSKCFGTNKVGTFNDKRVVYVLPAHANSLLQAISAVTNGADTIDVGMQGVGNKRILNILKRALNNGSKVRLIVDDDLYWAGQCKCDGKFNSYSEYVNWLAPLIVNGAEVRYMQTNHHYPGQNLFHHKVLIARKASGSFVLTGAANFTASAFSTNYENNYIFGGAVARLYEAWFDDYWANKATAREDMPRVDSSAFLEPVP